MSTRQFSSYGRMEGVAGGVSCVRHLELRTPLGLVGKTRFPTYGTRRPDLGAVNQTDPTPQRVLTRSTRTSNESWEQMDSVDLREVFLQRVPMLQSCPWFLQDRLRFSSGVALRERHRAKLEGDHIAESRA